MIHSAAIHNREQTRKLSHCKPSQQLAATRWTKAVSIRERLQHDNSALIDMTKQQQTRSCAYIRVDADSGGEAIVEARAEGNDNLAEVAHPLASRGTRGLDHELHDTSECWSDQFIADRVRSVDGLQADLSPGHVLRAGGEASVLRAHVHM